MDAFTQLSHFYDQMVGADYQQMHEFLCTKIKQYNPSAKLLVDLGCGSGTLTLKLSQSGYDVIGIDNSDAMLAQAAKKSSDNKILWLQQDMQELDLYGTVDVIVCTLDGFNYLADDDDLRSVIKRCFLFLNPNGLLIFDVNTNYKYESILKDQCFVYETPEAYCVWETEKDGDDIFFDLTFFVEQPDGRYIRHSESQQQHYFSEQKIKQCLNDTGFTICEITADYQQKTPEADTQRLLFIAQKE